MPPRTASATTSLGAGWVDPAQADPDGRSSTGPAAVGSTPVGDRPSRHRPVAPRRRAGPNAVDQPRRRCGRRCHKQRSLDCWGNRLRTRAEAAPTMAQTWYSSFRSGILVRGRYGPGVRTTPAPFRTGNRTLPTHTRERSPTCPPVGFRSETAVRCDRHRPDTWPSVRMRHGQAEKPLRSPHVRAHGLAVVGIAAGTRWLPGQLAV